MPARPKSLLFPLLVGGGTVVAVLIVGLIATMGKIPKAEEIDEASAAVIDLSDMSEEFNRKAYPDDPLRRCWAVKGDCRDLTNNWVSYAHEIQRQFREQATERLDAAPGNFYLKPFRRRLTESEQRASQALDRIAKTFGAHESTGKLKDFYETTELVSNGFSGYRSFAVEPFQMSVARAWVELIYHGRLSDLKLRPKANGAVH